MQLAAFAEQDTGTGDDTDGQGGLQQCESGFGVIRGAAVCEGAIDAEITSDVDLQGTAGGDDASTETGRPGCQQRNAAGGQGISGEFRRGDGGGVTAAAGDERRLSFANGLSSPASDGALAGDSDVNRNGFVAITFAVEVVGVGGP